MPSIAENFLSQEAEEPTREEKPLSPSRPQEGWSKTRPEAGRYPLCPAEWQRWRAEKLREVEARRAGFKGVNATGCLERAGWGKNHLLDAGAPEIAASLDSPDARISERT